MRLLLFGRGSSPAAEQQLATPEGATAHSQSRSEAEDGDEPLRGRAGRRALRRRRGGSRLTSQHLLLWLASVAVIYVVEDGLDPLEVLLQSGSLERGQTLLFK